MLSVLHRRSRLALTIVELLVVLSLTSALGIVVIQAVDSVSRAAVASTSRAVAQNESREAIELLVRNLRGARPLGLCLDPGQPAVRTEACGLIGEGPSVVEYASTRKMVFYAYAREEALPTGPGATNRSFRFPDRVVVEIVEETVGTGANAVRQDVLQLKVYAPKPGLSYTERGVGGSWQALPVLARRVGALPPDQQDVFDYYTVDGVQVPYDETTGAVEDINLKAVALVEVHPTFSHRAYRGEPSRYTVDVFVNLPGSQYARETQELTQ